HKYRHVICSNDSHKHFATYARMWYYGFSDMKYKNFKKNKKFALILLLTLLVVVIAAVIYVFMNSRMKTSGYEDGSGINYDPPTNEEKQAGDKQKDETLQEEKARNNS